MRRLSLLIVLLAALAFTAQAQPSLCTITGTIYRPTGAVCNACKFTVVKSKKGGVVLSTIPFTVTADSNGAVSFTAVQGSIITLQGDVWLGTYTLAAGKDLYVPVQSSATLSALKSTEDALDGLISPSVYAPADEPFVTKTASANLSNEFALGSLATGILKNTTTTGIPTIAVAGTDYEFPLTFAARLNRSVNTIDLATTAVTPGSYTAADITVDAYGRITAAANGSGGGGAVSSVFGRTGAVTAATNDYTWAQIDKTTSSLADLTTRSAADLNSGTLPLARLSGITNTEISNSAAIAYSKLNLTGAILNADLAGSIANAKLANSAITIAGTSTSLGGSITLDTITSLSTTGVVKRTGANTLAIGSVDLTAEVTGDLPFANFVQAGSAGFVGATGAGDYSHRTPTQVTAALDAFAGDSGSGGTKGLVPAPASGDAAANKYLKADGTWATVSAGSGITVGTTTITSGTNTRVLYNNSGVVGEYAVTGTGNAVLSASPTLTGTVDAAAATFSNTVSLTSTTAANNLITQGAAINIGTTSTDGIVLQNTTAAAAGAQQYSPRLRLSGRGWKTNATAASQTVDWAIENQPVQGAANPTGNLAFINSINGAAYTSPLLITSSGNTQSSVTSGVAYSFAAQPTAGFGIAGTTPAIYVGGTLRVYFNSAGIVQNGSGNTIAWSNGGLAGFASTTGLRLTNANGGSGIGNLFITDSTGTIGTSGAGVLVMQNGTAPTSSPADEFQLYSADSAAGDANAFVRNEAGEINRLTGLAARNSSSFAKTSDTTLANITGLTRNVEAGRAYAFTATLQTTAAATGGVKFAVSGTATATSISYEGVLVDSGAIVNQTRATALDTVVCASTTSTAGTCTIKGVVVIANAGTLTIQFAQNASDGGASTVLVNQFMQLVPIS